MPAKTTKPSFIDSIISLKGIAILIGILLLLSAGTYFYTRRNTIKQTVSNNAPPTPTPTPTPIKLHPDNGTKGTYSISQGKHVGATVSQIIIDPLDAAKNQLFTVTAKIKNSVPIQKVTGSIQTDGATQNISLERISGTDNDGDWQGSIVLNDTVLYTYILKITTTATNGVSNAVVSPR